MIQFLALLGVVSLLAFAGLSALEMWLWHKGPIGKILGSLLATWLAFNIYTAFYPMESFYRDEFVNVTGYKFPKSGKFKFKSASYPDFHGDYEACAVIEISEDDFQELKMKNQKIEPKASPMGSPCMQKLSLTLGNAEFVLESSKESPGGEYRYWALVSDRPEIVIHYASW